MFQSARRKGENVFEKYLVPAKLTMLEKTNDVYKSTYIKKL